MIAVATRVASLPLLNLAAENGQIDYSSFAKSSARPRPRPKPNGSNWLETHHIVFYRDDGQTVPANLLVLCACHRNLHRGYLRIEGSRAQGLRFLDREGRYLAHQVERERALWLNGNLGWKGGELDSHYHLARVGVNLRHCAFVNSPTLQP